YRVLVGLPEFLERSYFASHPQSELSIQSCGKIRFELSRAVIRIVRLDRSALRFDDDAYILALVLRPGPENRDVRPPPRSSNLNRPLQCEITQGVAVFLNQASSHPLPNMFFRRVLPQHAGYEAPQLPGRHQHPRQARLLQRV